MVTKAMKDNGLSGGEGGQRMTALAISSDGKLLIAGTDVAGMWRSEDGGKNWEMVYGGFYAKGVFSVAIDPVNKNRVIAYGGYQTQDASTRYANMANGLYLSEDGGKTWKFVLQQKGAALRLNFTESIAYDPSSYDEEKGMCMVAYWSRPWDLQDMPMTNAPYYNTDEDIKTFAKNEYDGILTPYREDTKALWKTTDGGKTWNPVCDGFTDGIVKVHPNNGTVYVSNLDGFHRSTDGGKTFTTVKEGMIYGLDVINTHPDNVYINDSEGVWISEDSGATFSKKTIYNFPSSYDTKTPDGIVRNLKVNPKNPDEMVIASHQIYNKYNSKKYYTTTFLGSLWWAESDYDGSNDFFKANNRDTCYVWSPDGEKVWAFGGDWIVSSTNGGETYSWDYNGGSAVYMDGRAAFNVYDPDIFYYGAQDFHGALTTDGGDTWKHIWKWANHTGTSGVGQGYGSVYGAYAIDANTLVAIASVGTWGAERRIFMSYDAGETWTDTGVVVSKNTNYKWAAMCYQSPTNKDVIFAGNFRSGDKGKTWTALDGVDVVCCHNPYDKMELYGYDVNGNIKVSYDDGKTWQQVAKAKMPSGVTGGTINDMAYDGINNILYYVSGSSSSRSVYKLTINNGKTTDLTNNLVGDENFGVAVQLIAVDPVNPEIVYVGGNRTMYVQENSVQCSTDGGLTFQVISTGSTDSVISGPTGGIQPYDLLVHPETGELWVSNGCRGWTKISIPYTK